MKQEPIIVCGGGIAGMACAIGLVRAGLNVQILGPYKAPAPLGTDEYHPRVYAISAASQDFLTSIGAWHLLDKKRISTVQAMEIFGDANGLLDLSAWQDARLNLAHIVESSQLELALQQVIRVLGINWHDDQFISYEKNGSKLTVNTLGGLALPTSLIVGADGGRSAVRQAAAIPHSYTPYGDMGVVAHVDAELPHQNCAYQWFTGDSVFALLPMPDTAQGPQVSLVWSMYGHSARTWLAMSQDQQKEYFSKNALAITEARLGRLALRSKPQGFPLTLERTDMVAPGVALVGDAAHRVHPLAGQGLNLGLGDARDLIQVLGDNLVYPYADMRVLSRYRRKRAEPVMAMAVVTDGLHKLFALQSAPIAWVRNAGMQVINNIPFIKRRLIKSAAD